MRPCRVPGCDRERKEGHLLCSRCWYKVPADVRAEVWRSYRLMQELAEDGTQDDPQYAAIPRRYANAVRHATQLAEEALSRQ